MDSSDPMDSIDVTNSMESNNPMVSTDAMGSMDSMEAPPFHDMRPEHFLSWQAVIKLKSSLNVAPPPWRKNHQTEIQTQPPNQKPYEGWARDSAQVFWDSWHRVTSRTQAHNGCGFTPRLVGLCHSADLLRVFVLGTNDGGTISRRKSVFSEHRPVDFKKKSNARLVGTRAHVDPSPIDQTPRANPTYVYP